ncbi:MAG TPA: alcohol dehydrogenase catalytic domain-containing protein, partial [Ilumatobacter sp.]|nr:alcohol dehydrogenase catalytic domain-containing protein [Ilumatobacter sp.]
MTGGVEMKCNAAVLHGVNQEWSVEEIEVDGPKAGEVLVQWTHAGLCHSDEHLITGDIVPPDEALALIGSPGLFPAIGGHEGSGIVVEVGAGVTGVAVGDHVSASF